MPGAWDSKQPHWTRTGVLVAVFFGVLTLVVTIALAQGSGTNGSKSGMQANPPVASETSTPLATSDSPKPRPSQDLASASASTASTEAQLQPPAVAKPPTRTATTPLSLDIKFDKWGQIGPTTWQRKCCSFRITTLLSDQFGDMSGADECWITITLLLNGTQPTRTINGVCGDGWADAYKGLDVGNWALRFQATTVWGQSVSIDKPITIVPESQ